MKTFFAISALLLFPGIVAAQSSSLFPSSSSGSSSSGGSSIGGSSSLGSSGSGMTSGIQQGLSGGGTGQGGAGTTFGTGELQGPQFTQFGQAGAAALEQEFIGVSDTGTFVGVDQATTGQQGAQSNRQSLEGFGDRGEGPNQSQGRSTTGRSRVERLQPVMRIAFDYNAVPASQVQTNIETRLLDYQFDIEGMGISLNDQGVLTLTGVAASQDASRLAETFLRLEPGVRQVDNQIVVSP